MAFKKTTIHVEQGLYDRVRVEAESYGTPWATMLKLLAREAIEARETKKLGAAYWAQGGRNG